MSKPDEFNKLQQQVNLVKLPRIDVSSVVMKQISMIGDKDNRDTHIHYFLKHRRAVWLTAVVLFFSLAVTVSASILPLEWNGERIAIKDDGGNNASIDAIKERIFGQTATYKDIVEDVLNNHTNAQQVVSLDEANEQFPFIILRPDPSIVEPARSNGALMHELLQENGGEAVIIGYRPVFHDIYELEDDSWIIVTQSLDQAGTTRLQEEGNIPSTSTYIGAWENVEINETIIAIYTENKHQNRLVIKYKNPQNQVIDLRIIGTSLKEDLMELATAYTGL